MQTAPPAARVRLPLGSPELAHALAEGHLPGAREILRPLAVASGEVELAVGPAPGRPASGKVWFTAMRAISLTATATPCIAALMLVKLLGLPLDLPVAALALVGALALQMGVNLLNDVEDHRRLIDLPGTFGGSGVLQSGWLTPRAVKNAALGLFVLGALCGLPTVLRAPGPMAVVALVAAVGSLGYSGRRLGFKYRALGDITVLLLCGPALTLGFGVAASGELVPALIPLGLCMGLLAVGLLHANNLQDADIDAARGARTLASTIGPNASRLYLAALYVGALAAWFVTARMLSLPALATVIPLVMLLPTAGLLRDVFKAADPHVPELHTLRIRAAQLHLGWGVLTIVALAVAPLFKPS